MLMNLHKKEWTSGLYVHPIQDQCAKNHKSVEVFIRMFLINYLIAIGSLCETIQ